MKRLYKNNGQAQFSEMNLEKEELKEKSFCLGSNILISFLDKEGEDEGIVFNMNTGEKFFINNATFFILKALDKEKSVNFSDVLDLVKANCKEDNEELEEKICFFTQKLKRLGLIDSFDTSERKITFQSENYSEEYKKFDPIIYRQQKAPFERKRYLNKTSNHIGPAVLTS